MENFDNFWTHPSSDWMQSSDYVKKPLDLRKSIFPFLNRELFDLRKVYVVNLKTGRPKICLL